MPVRAERWGYADMDRSGLATDHRPHEVKGGSFLVPVAKLLALGGRFELSFFLAGSSLRAVGPLSLLFSAGWLRWWIVWERGSALWPPLSPAAGN